MPLFLVGMPGSGKTTVAGLLSKALGWPVNASDSAIEAQEGLPIPEIFATYGEGYFRQQEADWFYRLPQWGNYIADTGGGLPCHHHLMLGIRTMGPSVYLEASPAVLLQRLNQRGHWPASVGEERLPELETLLETRKPFYRLADLVIPCDNLTPEAVAHEIIRYFELS